MIFAFAGRLARRSWWAADPRLRGAGRGRRRRRRRSSAAPPSSTCSRSSSGSRCGWPAWRCSPRRCAAPTAPGRRRRRCPRSSDRTRRGFLLSAGTMAALGVGFALVGRAVGGGRRHVEETRRLLRLSGVTPPRIPGECAAGRRGHRAVDDVGRRLLPRAHRDRGADDRADRLEPADPRHGRPRGHRDLRGAARARAHGVLDHPQLRLEPRRRVPHRQRPVERCPRRRAAHSWPACTPTPTPCCRPRTTAGPAVRRSSRSPTTATRCSRSR